MKNAFLTGTALVFLSTSVIAETKPYLGLGLNCFTTKATDIHIKRTSTGETTTFDDINLNGTGIGLNGGLILNDFSKINISYFSKEATKDFEKIDTTVLAISYDYSFNNWGVRKGFYIGGGISSVTTKPVVSNLKASNESGVGLLLKGGYEYKMTNNFLLDISYNLNLSEQNIKFDTGNPDFTAGVTTQVNHFTASINYIFSLSTGGQSN